MDQISTANEFRLKKIFTDIHIKFYDGKNCIEVDAHKIILASNSPYFASMLTFGGVYDTNYLEIKVPDAFGANDLVLSFYDYHSNIASYTKWHHALALEKCRRFFLVETIPMDISRGEKIDEGDFDYFLELCGLIGFDDDNIYVVARNMPSDYDLGKLSIDLIQSIANSEKYPVAFVEKDKKVLMMNMINNETIMEFSPHTNLIRNVIISKNKQYVATISTEKINIWNMENMMMVYNIHDTQNIGIDVYNVKFTNNSTLITVVIGNGFIETHDFIKGTILYTHHTHNIIRSIEYSPDDVYLVAKYFNNSLDVWNTMDKSKLFPWHSLFFDIDIISIKFSSNSKYLCTWHNDKDIKICSMDTLKQVEMDGKLILVSFSDINYIVLHKNPEEIEVWDIDSQKLVQLFQHKMYKPIIFSPDNKYIMLRYHYEFSIWNILSGTIFRTFNTCRNLIISPQMKYIAREFENKIFIYTFNNDIQNVIIDVDFSQVFRTFFTPDDKYIIRHYFNSSYKIFGTLQETEINAFNTIRTNDQLVGEMIPTNLSTKLSTYLALQ